MSIRPVIETRRASPHIEGAGVHLHAPSGSRTRPRPTVPAVRRLSRRSSPGLLGGVPVAPHRGIETITYVLAGTVEHGDSLGNKGTLGRDRCS